MEGDVFFIRVYELQFARLVAGHGMKFGHTLAVTRLIFGVFRDDGNGRFGGELGWWSGGLFADVGAGFALDDFRRVAVFYNLGTTLGVELPDVVDEVGFAQTTTGSSGDSEAEACIVFFFGLADGLASAGLRTRRALAFFRRRSWSTWVGFVFATSADPEHSTHGTETML